MNIFYKICVILIIIGGINWGLIGLFSFDAVAWLLGGSASLLSPAVYTVVGIAALCAIRSQFGSELQARGRNNAPGAFSLSSGCPGAAFTKRVFGVPRQRPPLPFLLSFHFSESPPGGDLVHIVRRALYRNPTFWYIICYKCAHLVRTLIQTACREARHGGIRNRQQSRNGSAGRAPGWELRSGSLVLLTGGLGAGKTASARASLAGWAAPTRSPAPRRSPS